MSWKSISSKQPLQRIQMAISSKGLFSMLTENVSLGYGCISITYLVVSGKEENMKFIDEIDLKDKRVLFRFDFNVPMDGSRNITDDTRIRTVLPTVNYALDEGAKVIIMSHLGRPKGKVVPEMSLAPVAKRLTRLLGKDVRMLKDCIGDEVKRAVAELQPGFGTI